MSLLPWAPRNPPPPIVAGEYRNRSPLPVKKFVPLITSLVPMPQSGNQIRTRSNHDGQRRDVYGRYRGTCRQCTKAAKPPNLPRPHVSNSHVPADWFTLRYFPSPKKDIFGIPTTLDVAVSDWSTTMRSHDRAEHLAIKTRKRFSERVRRVPFR